MENILGDSYYYWSRYFSSELQKTEREEAMVCCEIAVLEGFILLATGWENVLRFNWEVDMAKADELTNTQHPAASYFINKIDLVGLSNDNL